MRAEAVGTSPPAGPTVLISVLLAGDFGSWSDFTQNSGPSPDVIMIGIMTLDGKQEEDKEKMTFLLADQSSKWKKRKPM